MKNNLLKIFIFLACISWAAPVLADCEVASSSFANTAISNWREANNSNDLIGGNNGTNTNVSYSTANGPFADLTSAIANGTSRFDFSAISSGSTGTLHFRVRDNATAAEEYIISGSNKNGGDPDNRVGVGFGVDTINRGRIVFDAASAGTSFLEIESPADENDNVWHGVDITMGAAGNAMLIDGTPVTPNYHHGNATTRGWFGDVGGLNAFNFGYLFYPPVGQISFFTGNIRDVALFPTILTSTQFAELYGSCITPPPPPPPPTPPFNPTSTLFLYYWQTYQQFLWEIGGIGLLFALILGIIKTLYELSKWWKNNSY